MVAKIAFVSLWNAAEPNAESGYAYSMRCQLQKRFDVVDVFPLTLPGEKWWLPVRAAYKLAGRYYHPMREPSVLQRLARGIEHALQTIEPDVVFAPSSVPMSFVRWRRPRVYATDQLFCDFAETYIGRCAQRFRRAGEAQESRAIEAAALATYPSHWAARSAVERYGADTAKVPVIPWGANLPSEIEDTDVRSAIAARSFDTCELVFIGRDWQRKGGDRFAAIVSELNRSGLKTRGTIIGADPKSLPVGNFAIHPYLDKQRADHFALFANILSNAHFLVAPARAEAYGQALCEAFAFGVPVIASAVGGIPTIVRDGVTGFLLPPDAQPRDFAVRIQDALANPQEHRRMAQAARDDYRERLNWNSFGARLNGAIEALL